MSIKGKHLGIMLAGCMLAGTVQAQPQGEQYAKAQLAIADVDGFSDNGVAVVGTFGLQLPQVNRNFYVEGELSASVDNPQYSYAGYTMEYSYYALAGYAVYAFPASPKIKLFGRAGLRYVDATFDEYIPFVGRRSVSDSSIGMSFGVGTDIAIGKTTGVTVGLTVIDNDITNFSAGMKFGF